MSPKQFFRSALTCYLHDLQQSHFRRRRLRAVQRMLREKFLSSRRPAPGTVAVVAEAYSKGFLLQAAKKYLPAGLVALVAGGPAAGARATADGKGQGGKEEVDSVLGNMFRKPVVKIQSVVRMWLARKR